MFELFIWSRHFLYINKVEVVIKIDEVVKPTFITMTVVM